MGVFELFERVVHGCIA